MVKGHTYGEQLFESKAFRHFVNMFLNKESGITRGCELAQTSNSIEVEAGFFAIEGGLLENTGTTMTIPNEAGYYKLVYEIDLSKTNTQAEFNQGNFKFVKSIGEYPSLTQEDLDAEGNIYQLAFCQFRITESGIQDFLDIREFIDYGIYERKPHPLWQGDTNDVTTIIFPDNISNYTKIKLFFRDNDNQRGSVEVDNSNKLNEIPVSIYSFYNSGQWFNVKMRSLILSDNKIMAAGHASYEFSNNQITYSNNIFITKIEGYK